MSSGSSPRSPSTESSAGQAPQVGRLLARRRVLWWLGGGAVLVTAGGLAAGQLVRSPAQRLAETAPPPRSVLTATVEQRVLSDTVVLRGQVGASTTVEITPAPAGDAGRVVVTGVRVAPGDQFEAGAVLLEVSGRPVFALAGEVPAYRDLRPGTSGRDIEQLQQALADLGHQVGEVDGAFGAATKRAVAVFYQDLGYEAPTTGDPAAVRAAEDAVRQAERALATAEETLERIRADPPSPAPGEPDPVRAAQRQVTFAQEDLAAARSARDEAVATTGAMVPLAEVVFLPEFPARVESSSARVGLDLGTAELDGPLLTASSGVLVVRAQLNPAQRELLGEGMPVEIFSELDGISADGEVSRIGEPALDPQTGARGSEMVVEATGEPLDEQLAGADVRLTVAAAATDAEVLVVPLSAVFAGADGQTAVLRVDPDGSQQRVPVSPGVSGDGYVAVNPLSGELGRGDQVVVGAGGAP